MKVLVNFFFALKEPTDNELAKEPSATTYGIYHWRLGIKREEIAGWVWAI